MGAALPGRMAGTEALLRCNAANADCKAITMLVKLPVSE
jgi:hypothetical protein